MVVGLLTLLGTTILPAPKHAAVVKKHNLELALVQTLHHNMVDASARDLQNKYKRFPVTLKIATVSSRQTNKKVVIEN